MPRKKRTSEPRYVMISVVAEQYGVHPQTLRLYERQGLIKPARSAGNTRLYDELAIQRLEAILTLTREMGINLAGVEVILGLREELDRLRSELDQAAQELRRHLGGHRHDVHRERALVPTGPRALVRR